MMKIRAIRADNGSIERGEEEQFYQWIAGSHEMIWLDIEGDDPARAKHILESIGAHELVISDALRDRHPPKIESFDEYTFILYRGILSLSDDLEYAPCQLAFFVKDKLLVTYHRTAVKSVDSHYTNPGLEKIFTSPAQLAISIMHQSAGLYVSAVLEFEDHLSELEDGLNIAVDDRELLSITSYKSRLLKLKRVFSYHESLGSTLKSGDCTHFSEDNEPLMHAVYALHDRFERVYSLLCMYYDICGDLIDGYLSITSHRMNQAMRVLTVVMAIFVPLSFMAGLYGMNFDYMPELKVHYAYYAVLGTMLATAAILLLIFRRKRWL